MGISIVTHVDEIPYLAGEPSEPQEGLRFAYQSIGDRESKPWVYVQTSQPGRTAPTHSHGQDEVFYVLQGEMVLGESRCGPGTVIYIERGTEYGFTAGPEGVRFLNVRSGPDKPAFQGGEHPEPRVGESRSPGETTA
jgi:hypothetical protein